MDGNPNAAFEQFFVKSLADTFVSILEVFSTSSGLAYQVGSAMLIIKRHFLQRIHHSVY